MGKVCSVCSEDNGPAPLPSFNHVARQFPSFVLKGRVWKDFLVIFLACSLSSKDGLNEDVQIVHTPALFWRYSIRRWLFIIERSPYLTDGSYAQSTCRIRGEIGRLYLPSQLERTPQLCS
jgi:hypothetical protein